MNGALVIAAVVAVIEIGSPVATNLGLSVGAPSTAGQVAGPQILQNAAAPSWEQAAASVAHATSPGSVVALPSTAEALASNVTTAVAPSVVPAAPVVELAVTSSPKVVSTPAPTATVAAAIVASPERGVGAADAVTHPTAQGPSVGSDLQHGDGQQGRDGSGPPGPLGGAALGGDRPTLGGEPVHGPPPGHGGPGDGGEHAASYGAQGGADAGSNGHPPCHH